MPRTRSLLIAAALLLILSATARADTITINATSDTYVRSDQPNTHNDASSSNPLQLDGNPIRKPLLYFKDVPSQIYSAKLRVHSEYHTGEPFSVRASSCYWSEGGLPTTHNTVPTPGDTLATIPDDPVGYVEAIIPADRLKAGSNCLQLTKSGDNWTDITSTTASYPPQLVIQTTAPPPPPADADGDGVPDLSDACPGTPAGTQVGADGCPITTTSPVAKCDGTPVSATPSTLSSVIANHDNVVITAQPGTYSNLPLNQGVKTCVEIHCAVAANESTGCRVSSQTVAANVRNLTIEGFAFVGSIDYGLSIYDESPNVGMKVRIAKNIFHGDYYHDISTKVRVAYTEVVDNTFISCMRHCWEIGQNENLPSRPSTTATAIFRGNKVSSRINGLTQRSNINLTVQNNEFRSTSHAIHSWPLWYATNNNMVPAVFQVGSLTVLNQYPALRTTITANNFVGTNTLRFEGRGTIDDVVLLRGNTGTVPSCVRASMDSSQAATYFNEQTTLPPKLDAASDVPC